MDTSAFDARIRGADATLEQRREQAEHTERAVRAEAVTRTPLSTGRGSGTCKTPA